MARLAGQGGCSEARQVSRREARRTSRHQQRQLWRRGLASLMGSPPVCSSARRSLPAGPAAAAGWSSILAPRGHRTPFLPLPGAGSGMGSRGGGSEKLIVGKVARGSAGT